MKKIIALTALLASMSIFAGPKADLEKAEKLIKQNKIEEAMNIFKKSKKVKGEEKEYEKVNVSLALYYINQKNEEEAMKYLNKVSEDLSSKTEEAKMSDNYLYQLSKSNKDKIKYLTRFSNRMDNKELNVLVALVYLNTVENNNLEVNRIMSEANKNGINFVELLNYNLISTLILEDYAKAEIYINKSLNSKNSNIVANTHLLLAMYNFENKNDDKANIELEKAEKKGENNPEILYKISEIYKVKGDLNKNYEYLKKAYKLAPKEEIIILNLILNSFDRKDEKSENRWIGILKNLNKNYNYLSIAAVYLQNNEFDIAEKYALKAVKTDSKANLMLAIIYGNKGDKDLSEKYAKKALENEETKKDAQQIFKQLKKFK